VNLGASLQDVDPLLGRHGVVTVEVGGALLKLGEVLHRLEGALRPEEALDVHAAQRRGVDPVPELLGPDVTDQVRGLVGVPVHVAVEAGHPDHPVGTIRPPVLGGVELLLGELRDQEAQAFELFRVQQAVEGLVEVLERDDLALRDVAKIRPGRQENRRRKLRKQVIRQIEVEVETVRRGRRRSSSWGRASPLRRGPGMEGADRERAPSP
jgi:hypothetical protein